MIILDLDGVLCDFTKAAFEVHGVPYEAPRGWNFFEEWPIPEAEFWSEIHALGEEFYRDVARPYSYAFEIYDAVRESDDFVIMTAPSTHASGYSGKFHFVSKYFPDAELIVGKRKDLLAGKDRTLVDDSDANIDKFAAAGGNTLLVPQPWNKAAHLVDNRMSVIRTKLNSWKKFVEGLKIG